MRRLGRAATGVPAALAGYLALGWLALYPLSTRPRDGVSYIGDPHALVYLVAWYPHQLLHDPLHPFDSNILFPTPHAGTLTDHQLLPSLVLAPVVWATGN